MGIMLQTAISPILMTTNWREKYFILYNVKLGDMAISLFYFSLMSRAGRSNLQIILLNYNIQEMYFYIYFLNACGEYSWQILSTHALSRWLAVPGVE